MAAELLGGCILMLATYMSSFLGSWFDAWIRRTLHLCTLICTYHDLVVPDLVLWWFPLQLEPPHVFFTLHPSHLRWKATTFEQLEKIRVPLPSLSRLRVQEIPRFVQLLLGDSPKVKKNDWGQWLRYLQYKLLEIGRLVTAYGRSQIMFYQWTSRLEFSEEGLVNVPHYLSVSSRKQSPISKSQNQVHGESSCPAESPSQYRYFCSS